MKKFCSTCGNQLELSQRLCGKCGTVNPFFVSTFSFLSEQTDLSDQSEELEKLRLEKEKIEKELAEKEQRQREFILQEQLKKEAEEEEKMNLEKAEKEKLIKEQLEAEKDQMNIKKEISKRVKEEAELYKKETLDIVKGVKEELQHIEEDNKRLKEEVANLNRLSAAEKKEKTATPVSERNTKEKRLVVSLLVVLIGLTSVLAFLFFTNQHKNEPAQTDVESGQEVMLQPKNSEPIVTDTFPVSDTVAIVADTVPVKVKESENTMSAKTETKQPKETEVRPVKQPDDFVLTDMKIKKDMVGKRVSGCDIVIGSISEIEYVGNLVLVEKVASGNLKYKFTASITQRGETYTASPYIYYTAQGAFIKIDGTNCE